MTERPKAENLLDRVRLAVSAGNYIYSAHARQRQQQRLNVTDGDMKNAIRTGWHEKQKDEWSEEFQDWNYAIRGNSLDGDKLRVCIALQEIDENSIVIVTLINLDKEDES